MGDAPDVRHETAAFLPSPVGQRAQAGRHAVVPAWPHLSKLELAALPTAVSCGRLHTRHVLWEWRLHQLVDDAEVVVSELLSNAVKASGMSKGVDVIALRLLADDQRLVVEVWDHSPLDPQPRQVDEASEHGRGFMVIGALGNRWGYRRLSARVKVVWCELLVEGS
jgi:anti-sigma regulatory factor (Ser/Thr protein kinase)